MIRDETKPTWPDDAKPNKAEELLSSWDKRHDHAYHVLIFSLSETYKTLTLNCQDLTSTWKSLEQHFERKAAADIIAAEAQLARITLGDNDDILTFINNIMLIKNTMASAGAEMPDKKLFQAVIMKLPAKMNNLRDTILYGPYERKTYDTLEQTPASYANNHPIHGSPEHERWERKARKMQTLQLYRLRYIGMPSNQKCLRNMRLEGSLRKEMQKQEAAFQQLGFCRKFNHQQKNNAMDQRYWGNNVNKPKCTQREKQKH